MVARQGRCGGKRGWTDSPWRLSNVADLPVHKETIVKRTYELVYIMRPDASEQQVADLHSQVEQIVSRMGGTFGEKSEVLSTASRKRSAELSSLSAIKV